MYVRPEVSKYTGKQLLDLMGPVETGYCDIELIEEGGCGKSLQVNFPQGTDQSDFEERFDWQIIPADPGNCSDRENSGDHSAPCFGSIVEEDDFLRVNVDVCCLPDPSPCFPTPPGENWTLGFTLFRDNGSEYTCDIDLDVVD